jgi:hypothetical protein
MTPTDGEWAFVLGHADLLSYDLLYSDYVQIKQTVDLTSINIIRADAKVIQPSMPTGRTLTGATLKRGHIYPTFNPSTETSVTGHFTIHDGDKLVVEVDGGGDTTINFPGGALRTAQEVVDVINAALPAGGTAYVSGDTGDEIVGIRSDSVGNTATIEVKDYSDSTIDANDHLGFFQKVDTGSSDTKIYGGDDLSAIIVPDGGFTSAELGLPVQITGATDNPTNNFTNHLVGIVDSETAILRMPILDESVGFNATLLSSLWEASIYIGTWQATSVMLERGRELLTTDIAANVSKHTGSHDVIFRLELVSVY